MSQYRNISPQEIAAVEALGTSAESWSDVMVCDDFGPTQLVQSRLEGAIWIDSGARIVRSTVRNYRIGAGSLIEGVTALECRQESSFGNGVEVATINENGGRSVRICDTLTAQVAYLQALYGHRPEAVAAIKRMVGEEAAKRNDTIGTIGTDVRITGARLIREVRIGDRVTIDGASLLENGTICAGAHIGCDVQAHDFIVAEDAHIDGGALLERCFVGECCHIGKHFSAVDSLFFANCHCENGEAVSIFAGPYTVSHHKASLLIAGMFSFFNAGSAANQSNHLFKSGPVHQAIHLRGCKFGSGTYIMAPAAEGAFTLVLGRHSKHHDTTMFPYSYLVEQEGRSALMPGANLISYGTVRDIEKWPARDRRTIKRDRINFEEENPYLTGAMIDAVNTLNELAEANPQADSYVHNQAVIKAVQMRRGLKLYNKAIVASLGAMLARTDQGTAEGRGRWSDLAGQYAPRSIVRKILDGVESGAIDSLEAIDREFTCVAEQYDRYARGWAEALLAELLGHTPSPEEIAEAIAAGERTRAELRKSAEDDKTRDFSEQMSIGYGIEADTPEERQKDYHIVRGIQ